MPHRAGRTQPTIHKPCLTAHRSPPPLPRTQLGFKRFVVPASSNIHPSPRIAGASIVECRTVLEAFRAVLGTGGRGRQQ